MLGVRSTPPSYNVLHFSFVRLFFSTQHFINNACWAMSIRPYLYESDHPMLTYIFALAFVLQTNKQSNQSRFSINKIYTHIFGTCRWDDDFVLRTEWNTKNCVDFISRHCTVANVNTHIHTRTYWSVREYMVRACAQYMSPHSVPSVNSLVFDVYIHFCYLFSSVRYVFVVPNQTQSSTYSHARKHTHTWTCDRLCIYAIDLPYNIW